MSKKHALDRLHLAVLRAVAPAPLVRVGTTIIEGWEQPGPSDVIRRLEQEGYRITPIGKPLS